IIKKIFLHEGYIALPGSRIHWVILVQVKGDDVAKAKPFFFMPAHQFLVNLYGSSSCSQPKYSHFSPILLSLNKICNTVGNTKRGDLRIIIDRNRYFFKPGFFQKI